MSRVREVGIDGSSPEVERIANLVRGQRKVDLIQNKVPELFGVLLHRPEVAEAFLALGTAVRHRSILDPRVKELVTLKVSWLNRCGYLWRAHISHAMKAGITEAEMAELGDTAAPTFDEREKAALLYAEAMTRDVTVPDEVFRPVEKLFTEAEIVELSALIGFYNLSSRLLIALKIKDDGRATARLPFDDPLIQPE